MDPLRSASGLRIGRIEIPHVQALVAVQMVWMAVVFTLLQLLGVFTVENYYVVSYVGLVVAAQLFAPVDRSERWWRAVRWVLRLGFLVFCYFVATRAADVIQLSGTDT